MKDIFEKVLRESDYTPDATDHEYLLGVARKPTNVEEVHAICKSRPERTGILITENRYVDMRKWCECKSLCNIKFEKTDGWVRVIDEEEMFPDLYVDTQGYDYPRYVGMVKDDIEWWDDILLYD